MYGHLPDRELWAKVIEGDREALAFIYRSYFNSLFKYGMRLQADESLVKDAIHDIFVSLWHGRERLSSTDSIKYYLLASLKRKIAAMVQQQGRLTDALPDDAMRSPEDIIIGEQAGLELRQKLARIMEQLPPRQKEILHLRFYEGLDPQQTAALMDLSVNSAYVLLSKALSYLKKHSDQIMLYIFLSIQLAHF